MQAIEEGCSDLSNWHPIGRNYINIVTWEVLMNFEDPIQQAKAKTYGTLCALHMAWF
jgi:hypothetical protein